jgi:hypothetical protein
MTTDEKVNITLAVVTPILTSALGVLSLVVGDWRQRRTQAGRRKLALEDASRQVAFAADWWNARKQLADSPEAEQQVTTRALAWLEQASTRVEESSPPPVDENQAITLRRLFLAYPLHRPSARRLRVAFYFFLSCAFMYSGAAITFALNPEATTGLHTYFFGKLFYLHLGTISASIVVAMVLRFCAIRVEKSRPAREKQGRVTIRQDPQVRALLFYRFNRPAAKIVRIIFYIWALLCIWLAIAGSALVFDDPSYVPGIVSMLAVFVGWAVALRYWAVSLDARAGGEMSRVASRDTALMASQQPTPIGGTPVDAPLQQQ